MKKLVSRFLFGSSLGSNNTLNLAWLLFRLHVGISIALHAGWPKVQDPQQWFTDQVAGLGFQFPSPAFWAAMASWGELIGGILIAVGLLTRFAALQLAFQFFVIAFLWYDKPEPLSGMYFQQLYFWCYLLIAVAGGGKYAVDAWLRNHVSPMLAAARPVLTSLIMVLVVTGAAAQNGAQRGSGIIVNKSFDYKNFNRIELKDLDGTIEVLAGSGYRISAAIDDNLADLLEVFVKDSVLHVGLKENRNNKGYIESTNIRIIISLPELLNLQHRGNSRLEVSGIAGNSFSMHQAGNGYVKLSGNTGVLNLTRQGNGNLDAVGLTAASAVINSSGNGNLLLNVQQQLVVNASGNGDITNSGAANFQVTGKSGNGRLRKTRKLV